ncbi:MAG: hypothetical protein ACP5KN_08340 [Armatimonadota bacterium]
MNLVEASTPAPSSQTNRDALLDWLDEGNLPESEAELQEELDRWADAVDADPQDVGAQMGLMMTVLAMSSQNAAEAIGEDLFAQATVQDVVSMAFRDDLRPDGLVADAIATAKLGGVPRLRGPSSEVRPAADDDVPSPGELASWQTAIRQHLLPGVEDALARAHAIADQAAPNTELLSHEDDGETYSMYAADFDALAAGLQMVRAALKMASAINVNYGDFDWDVDLLDRDANGDSVLTVGEYAPPAPFANIDAAAWSGAGAAIRTGIAWAIAALNNRPTAADDLLNRALAEMDNPTIPQLQQYMADTRDVLRGQVQVHVEYATWDWDTEEWVDEGSTQIPLNMRELWDNPPTSFRALAPQLYVFPDEASYVLSDSTQLHLWLWHNDGEYCYYSLSPLTAETEEDLFPIAIGGGQHRAQFDSDAGAVDLTFSADWREVSGTIGGTSVTGSLNQDAWLDWALTIRWDEIPDRTISGVFPNPDQIRDLAMAGYDRYIITYGSFEIRDEPWWVY